ncbi:hypothetical protein C8Q80DRAFT_1269231 [Daedaleopsis nitida]|nr:hypothetical protein C8Q80DRAFT_1269231 [Daedaleopsis nitida]
MDFSSAKGKERATDADGFFMERLEMLYEQSLADLRAFAEREGRTYQEVKRRMAELHCRSLFSDPGGNDPQTLTDRKELTSQVLQGISRQLESLERLASMQSFFLVVNPNDPDDEGFLGALLEVASFGVATVDVVSPGRESSKRNVLDRNPKQHIQRRQPSSSPLLTPRKKVQSAREVKAELYVAMRDALRTACGIRTAEMKWTNHSNLYVYGVRILGWPDDIPQQNPSTLSTACNRRILDLLKESKISFIRCGNTASADLPATADEVPEQDEDAIFEDSIDYSWAVGEAEGDMVQTLFDN